MRPAPSRHDPSSETTARIVKVTVGLLVAVAAAWLVALPVLGRSGDPAPRLFVDDAAAPASDLAATTVASSTTTPVEPTPVATPVEQTTVEPSATIGSTTPVVSSTTTPVEQTTVASVAPSSPPPTTVAPPVAPAPAPTAPSTATPTDGTLPNGEPVPVLAVFDVDRVTLSGAVPSEPAAERLTVLAMTNSKSAAPVLSLLAVDPAVPTTVGVRVVELDSVRFPAGSAEVLVDHARELDRVAVVMRALPHVTVEVIGHADQRGDEDLNYRISAARAAAVVDHLVAAGVEPHRLSARAVGEADLLSLGDDDAALALNRRTEFVFRGIFVG